MRIALENGACVRFTATGSSMVPFLRNGEVVELVALSDRQPEVGDVVLAERPDGTYVLHRIVRLDVGQAYLASDSGADDGWIPLANLIGRARAVQRKGRWRRLDTRFARAAAIAWIRGRWLGWPLMQLALAVRSWFHRLRPGPPDGSEQPA